MPDVIRKHLKIMGYLTASALLAYVVSILTDKPEAVYLTPFINYVMYAIKQELDKEGYFQAIRNA